MEACLPTISKPIYYYQIDMHLTPHKIRMGERIDIQLARFCWGTGKPTQILSAIKIISLFLLLAGMNSEKNMMILSINRIDDGRYFNRFCQAVHGIATAPRGRLIIANWNIKNPAWFILPKVRALIPPLPSLILIMACLAHPRLSSREQYQPTGVRCIQSLAPSRPATWL